jgi:DNA topoisomerase-1
MGRSSVPATAPEVSAKLAGLKYVSDQAPGIRRVGAGKVFRYLNTRGKTIRDRETLQRIKRLAIPPAWRDVWISQDPNGHLQAVGRDARGRKQYRYHDRWREVRDSTKYDRMAIFGGILPRVRRRVQRDLKTSGLNRDKILATIVRLLETTSIRVGNEEYKKHNQSFGLTTLRNNHVAVKGEKVHFYFRGKAGIHHRISVEDRYLARIVKRLRDLPGYELFQYLDDDGTRRSIGSTDVNEYLRSIAGEDFTAKDFRTWTGTVLAASALCQFKTFRSAAQAKKNIVAAIESVAQQLGNTVAVCRKCYVHPAILNEYAARTLDLRSDGITRRKGLSVEEAAVLAILRKAARPQRKQTLQEALKQSIKQKAA